MTHYRSLFDDGVPQQRRLIRGVLLCMLVVACGFRVWLIVRYNPVQHIWSDPQRHWEHGIYALNMAPMALVDPILFQIYVGALAKMSLKLAPLVAYWTAVLSLAGPWLWYRFLRELLPCRDWALAGWVLLAALPSWSSIYSYFMQETLMLPLLGAALWATWRSRRKGSVASFVVAVGVWLLAGLTRGICIPLGIVAMSWLWFAQGEKIAKAGGSLVLLLAILGPLAARSWAVTGLIAPQGIVGVASLYYQSGAASVSFEFKRGDRTVSTYTFVSPSMNDPPLEPLSSWRARRVGSARIVIDLDAGPRDWKAAADQFPAWSVQRLARLTGDGLVHLFLGPSWPDSDRGRAIGQANYLTRWVWAPLTLACLAATLIRWRRTSERLLPALLLTWFLVQGLLPIVFNEGRYRKPFEGLLVAQCLVLAAAGRRPAPA